MDNIVYDIRWTDKLDEKFIADFLYVQNEVFGCGTREEFERQFEDNIYGKSIVVVVYLDDKPVAARALWRNDIEGKEAYQPGSTCVLPICRGKGIFSEMTKKSIQYLPSDAIIYNFPNNNSFPGYVKMGWNLVCEYRTRLYFSYRNYCREHPIKLDKQYAEWWLVGKPLKYVKIFRHYFILQKDRRTLCYHILAEVNEDTARLFPKLLIGFIFYKSNKTTWYNRSLGTSRLVSRDVLDGCIPTWKIDAV